MTWNPNILRPSRREVKNDVWKFLLNIVMGLYAVCGQNLAHHDRVLSPRNCIGKNHLISAWCGFRFVVWFPALHAKHLPPQPSCMW